MLSRSASLLCIGMCSCLALGSPSREELVRTVREYNNGLRWGHMDHVAPRMPAPMLARYQKALGALGDDLEIMDLEIVATDLVLPGDMALVRAELSWSLKRVGVLNRTTLMQRWVRRGSQWVLKEQMRSAGAPLALFDEPPQKMETPQAGRRADARGADAASEQAQGQAEKDRDR